MHVKSGEFILNIHILSAQSVNVSDPTSHSRAKKPVFIEVTNQHFTSQVNTESFNHIDTG